MTLAIPSSSRPASSSASVIWTIPVASNGTWTAPSKSEPSADVLDAGHADRVADRPGDRRGIVAAAGRRPEPDADAAPPVAAIAAELLVGQVAGVVARAADAGVRHDDRSRRRSPGRRRSSAAEACARSSDHPARLHPRDHLAARRGQAALLDAVRRAAERVVEEVARRHHPEAGVGDDVDVGRVVVERVRALDRQEAGRDRRVVAPAAPGRRRGRRADRMSREPALGRAPPSRRPASARCSARARRLRHVRRRPARGEREQDDVVAPVVVALDVQVARRLRATRRGPGARRCPRSAAGTSTWPCVAALEEVAAPQQRVGVEVGDQQRRVQRRGPAPRRRTAAARRVRHRRRSARPTRARPPARTPATAAAPTAAARSARARHSRWRSSSRRQATRQRVGVMRTTTGYSRRSSSNVQP